MKKIFALSIMIVSIILTIALTVKAEVKRFDVPIGDSPSIGPVNAPVTIIEFLDYQ